MEDKRSVALKVLNQMLIDMENSDSNYRRRTISLILRMIKEGRVSELASLIYLKISGKNTKQAEEKHYENRTNTFNGQFVVYTCIIGNYDKPIEPLYINDRCKYVLISDSNITETGSSWEWLDVSMFELPVKKQNEINRYVKLHPELFFPEYEYSIYIDGNIQVITDMMPVINGMGESIIGLHKHDRRSCAYEEAKTFYHISSMKKFAVKAEEQMKEYEEEGFPHNYGLYENPIIVRKHNTERCKQIMAEWWKQLTTFTMRDQISLPYVFWKLGVSDKEIYVMGNNLRKNARFRQYSHSKQ